MAVLEGIKFEHCRTRAAYTPKPCASASEFEVHQVNLAPPPEGWPIVLEGNSPAPDTALIDDVRLEISCSTAPSDALATYEGSLDPEAFDGPEHNARLEFSDIHGTGGEPRPTNGELEDAATGRTLAVSSTMTLHQLKKPGKISIKPAP